MGCACSCGWFGGWRFCSRRSEIKDLEDVDVVVAVGVIGYGVWRETAELRIDKCSSCFHGWFRGHSGLPLAQMDIFCEKGLSTIILW